jgi:hypothetical protein
MRRSHLKLPAAAALCLLLAAAAAAQSRPGKTETLPPVQKIYIGDMGNADEADRFRFLLEEQLLKRGFDVVLRPEDADALLTGALSVRTYDRKSEARVSVRLASRDGQVLWTRDFGHKRFRINPLSLQEPAKRRAEEVAEALGRDFRKPPK